MSSVALWIVRLGAWGGSASALVAVCWCQDCEKSDL